MLVTIALYDQRPADEARRTGEGWAQGVVVLHERDYISRSFPIVGHEAAQLKESIGDGPDSAAQLDRRRHPADATAQHG